MHDTQRPISDQIISSEVPGGTSRCDSAVISSTVDSPQIISSSLSNDVVLNGTKYDTIKNDCPFG